MGTGEMISGDDEIAAVARALARAPLVAFDLEFLSQDRLVPTLCLIQVSWLPEHARLDAPEAEIVAEVPEVRLIDPMVGDAGPVVRVLAAHPLVVAHAARQDLGLLATRFGTGMVGLVDTQVMAAFCGIGDQVGLAALAGDLLGLTLGKEQQWTAWDRRPLTPAQLAYAESDVRHLPALYARLAARLGARLAWARAESAETLADALTAAAVTADTAWRTVGGTRGLDDSAQGAVIALAAWRHRVAVELDRPLGQVLNDKLLVELARARPDTAGSVRALRGLSPLAKARAEELVAAIGSARPLAAAPRTPWRAPSERAQRWADILLAIVKVIAEDLGIAPRLLATRGDAEEVARVVDEAGLPAAAELLAFTGWRRDVLGTVWEAWLSGRLSIVGDSTTPHGIRLIPHA